MNWKELKRLSNSRNGIADRNNRLLLSGGAETLVSIRRKLRLIVVYTLGRVIQLIVLAGSSAL